MQEIILKNNHSDHFTLITYPDGQHSIKLNLDKLNVKETIFIKCRIRNFSELEVLLCLVTALRKYDFTVRFVNFVYLFGLRSDRAFEIGEPNYFRDVIKPILKLLDCELIFLSPHNQNMFNYNHKYSEFNFLQHKEYYILAGDESYYKTCENSVNGYFLKNRKEKIEVSLVEPYLGDYEDDNRTKKIEESEKILIIDDLCDGGATFIAEAEYLKNRYPDKKLTLYVDHGLFTNGFNHLLSYFEEIICTNSYQDIDHPKVRQTKVI